MKISTFLLSLILSIGLLPISAQDSNERSEAAFEPGQLLVQVPDIRNAQRITTQLSRIDGVNTKLTVADVVSEPMKIYLLTFDQDVVDPHAMLKAVSEHPAVNIAQFNHFVELRETEPNDPNFGQQWHHVNDGSGGGTSDADIDSDLAWDITTGGTTALGDEIVVCVIEGGNLDHTDLAPNAWVNEQEIPNNGIDDDGNGYVDDYLGWNVESNSDGGVLNGPHGTQVFGMIGAKGNNNVGVAGANWDVKLMSVAGENAQNEASVVAAYTYPLVMRQMYTATNGDSGAFVVATNASWGINNGQPENSPLWCAVYDTLGVHGILNCGATTNSNVNVDEVGDLPTACPSPYMVSVTATNNNDVRTFSGYGVVHVDVGAPGDAVYTTTGSDGYGTNSGTSFASPLTAGVIGLLYSAPCASLVQIAKANPQLGADMVLEALYEGVDIIPNLIDEVATGGRINSYNSLMYLIDNCDESGCFAPFSMQATQEPNTTNYTLSWSSIDAVDFDLRYRVVGDAEWIELDGLTEESFLASDLLYCTEYEFQVRANCDEESSEYSDLLTWETDGCCENPMFSITDVSTEEATVSWNSVLAAEHFNLRYRIQGDPMWIEINDILDTEYLLSGLIECASYEVQLQTICVDDQQEPYSTSVTFTTAGCPGCSDLDYCASVGDALYEWIESVDFSMFTNVSGSNDGYADFTEESHQMIVGEQQSFTLTPGFAGDPFNERFRIWIDYNQDGVFAESEMVYDSGGGSSEAVSGNFTIPESALVGATRMRISMKYVGFFGTDPPPGPCEPELEGETEDYCVFIDDVTSVESISAQHISVYPNPAIDEVVIDLGNLEIAPGELRYQLLDMTGRLIESTAFKTSRDVISINQLQNGIYSLAIYHGEERITVEQIVKTQ